MRGISSADQEGAMASSSYDHALHDQGIVIAAAYRSPTGRFRGSLASLDAVALASALVQEALQRTGVDRGAVDQVILGNVLSTGLGQNVARQVQINAGLPIEGTAMTVNQVCGSGLKAVRLAQTAVLMGDARVALAGGVESMSGAPAFAARRGKHDFDTAHWRDTLTNDGLNDAFGDYAMGVTAENLNRLFHLDRIRLDRYALDSQRKAAAARRHGWFDEEIVPINGLDYDEVMRSDSSLEALGALPPAFGEGGLVTAGNASPLSDGASMVLVTTLAESTRLGLEPLARISGYAETGYRPGLMGYTPVLAIRRLLERLGQQVSDVDLFEVNEAFASQALVVRQELGIDEERYNVSGGALALGHALGSSGTRILTTLLHVMRRTDSHRGVAALCIGGGQAVAMEVER
ncbi:thiolase family protein [Bifidobacterium mongoliense]|jgi:acetyl-CoA C-acetyltransferase|uniref:thiolase family protein n=1 Tax=Bifidobacterium mongoliense TaxID=518643 RepID=UPI002A74E93B|nr:thiolase family protein [Bifidobacterium mongoliense]MDY3126221.1 thiolase family protein [Bifidobacterium mongoliense]